MFKLVQYYCFRFLKFTFHLIDWCRLKLTGELESNLEYEKSAKVSTIYGRFKKEFPEIYFIGKKNFLYLHERFDHPSIVLNESVTLFTITPEEAVFVDCGDFDLFCDESVANMHLSQYEKALKLITLPIQSFHLIASQIPVPKASLLHIGNHGRCGSTLMYRMFQPVSGILSMAEPLSFYALSELVRTGELTKNDLIPYCKSIIKCLINHANIKKSEFVCFEPNSMSIYIADALHEAWPTMKHIYMYRNPVPFTVSYEKQHIFLRWKEMDVEIVKQHNTFMVNESLEMLSDYPSYTDDYIRALSKHAKWALHWITCNAAYNSFIKRGYPIVSVKFEEFLNDPETILQCIFKYFGIPVERIPDIKKILSKDSQANTVLSTQSADPNELKKKLTPITEEEKNEVDKMCRDFNVPLFSSTDVNLANKIQDSILI